MHEDLLKELEDEFNLIRTESERTEILRKEEIRRMAPEIHQLVQERESLVFSTLRSILSKEKTDAGSLPERMDSLSAAIRTKLTEKGYASDFLSPIYRCPICEDRGWTGNPLREPCSCLKKAYQQKLRKLIGLSGAGQESFEKFDLNLFPAEMLPGKS